MSASQSESEEFSRSLPCGLRQMVDRFEDAWQFGPRPLIEDYLPPESPDRRTVLIELVHVDLERRLKAGEAVRVEQYLGPYPELAADQAVVLKLLAAEYTLRRRKEPDLSLEEYRQRFPLLGDVWLRQLDAFPPPSFSPTSSNEDHVAVPSQPTFTPSMMDGLDQVCDSFEAAWKGALSADQRPRIEDYLAGTPEAVRLVLLRELISLEVAYRRQAGEQPQSEEYRVRFPALDREQLLNSFHPERAAVGDAVPAGSTEETGGSDPLGTVSHPQTTSGNAPQVEFQRGTLLKNRYLLERVLGRGGMGQVFLASDQLLHRPVAIKVIRPRDPHLRNRTICETRLRDAFAEEARIGANLTHPAIAAVFDYGFHNDEPFIVFEHMDGETLRDLLKRRGRLPLEEARLIIGSLSQALDFAHSRHVVHRDLKPENIRATLQGHFKILDLGLAKEFRHTVDWFFAGTPLYASPEQAAGLPCDGRTDQYALAVITYEIITGHKVFENTDTNELLKMHLSQEPPSPEQFLPDLPQTVGSALARALRKEPNERFETCQQFAIAIGCQLLSTPIPLSELLLLTPVPRMFGLWGNSRFRLLRWGTPVYLGLAADALWVSYCGEIRRWPLHAISEVQRDWEGGDELHLLLHGSHKRNRQAFEFDNAAECRQWFEKLQNLIKQLPPGTSEETELPPIEPVVLMREHPVMRYQALATLEFKDAKRHRDEGGLLIPAAMIGADAVVDVQQERLPELGRTVWRKSGMAIRAVDAAGRLELRSRWFAAEVSQITALMILFIIVSFGCHLFGSFLVSVLGIVGIGLPLASVGTIFQQLIAVVLYIILIHSWPLIIIVLARWLVWPQLLRPAALSLLALGAVSLPRIIGRLSGATATGRLQGLLPFLMFGDPLNLAFLLFSWLLCRRAWRVYSRYRAMVPAAEKEIPPLRRAATAITLASTFTFAALLWASAGWGGFRYVSGFALHDVFKERQALNHFNQGVAKMPQQPQEAEQAFRSALPLWEEIVRAAPFRPECRQNLGATYQNLGAALTLLGKPTEAEQAYRQAMLHYDKLETDFPSFHNHEKNREIARLNLTQLAIQKPSLEHLGEQMEGQRLAAINNYQAAGKVYRQALAHHEKLKNGFTDGAAYVRLLASKQNRLAWFLVTCPDVALRKPVEAAALANKAVESVPQQGTYWNTLGAAYYRAGDWNKSVEALEKSMALSHGGDGFDWFFLAMAHHQLRHFDDARNWLDKAVRWMMNAANGQLANPLHRLQWEAYRKEAYLLQREAEELITAPQSKN
jgi:serine/threonine-protein kinase